MPEARDESTHCAEPGDSLRLYTARPPPSALGTDRRISRRDRRGAAVVCRSGRFARVDFADPEPGGGVSYAEDSRVT